jgi:diguanylate cyclase (GGDEF)-like protein
MIDIDHFKAFNDTHGHAAGDDCLKAVAQALRAHCARPGDLVCRWGGEEFSVILPGTDAAGATHLAHELVEVVRALGLEHGKSDVSPCVTISAGSASVAPSEDGSAAALIEKADAALYAAKQSGRNRSQAAA